MKNWFSLWIRSYSSIKPSYWHQGGTEPLLCLTVGKLLDEAVTKWGNAEALVCHHQNVRMGFAEIKEQADKLAAGLRELGLNRKDRIAVWTPNIWQWYVTKLAAARCGAILVNVNPAYQPMELHYCLNKVEVKVLVVADKMRNHDYLEILRTVVPEMKESQSGQIFSRNVPTLNMVIVISENTIQGAFRFDEVMNLSDNKKVEEIQNMQDSIDPDEACEIQFTSGTTGHPKGCILSHHNLVNNAYFSGKRINLAENHRVCLQVPFYHCFAIVPGLLASLHLGFSNVVPYFQFSALFSIEAIIRERCNYIYGTPTMFIDIADNMEKENISFSHDIDIILTGGALMSSSNFEQIHKIIKPKIICSIYGMTEASPIIFMTTTTETRSNTLETVGCVLNHTEVKVVDKEGNMVPLSTPGELYTRGYLMCLGYWNDEKNSKELIGQDRWLRTGDQFILNEEGYGLIVGRIKDIIIRGGENIFPKEVENFISSHPDVLDAQVFGVPDERLGEIVVCYIRIRGKAHLTENDIRNYCKGKNNANMSV